MASNNLVQYSDDMIREELLKLGITDVEPTLFEQIKSDLREKSQGFTSTDGTKHSSIDSNVEVAAKKVVSAVTMTLDPEAEMRHRSHFQRESRGLSSGNLSMPSNTDSGTEIPNMLTRKVMRKSASGKPFVTVERLPLPDFKVQQHKNVSRGRSVSTDELWQRMSSVSLCSKSSGSSEKSRQSGVIVPNGNIKRKKCDPVTRYHEYRKYWDTFKFPGENKHKDVRWTMRNKLMNNDFC